MEPTTIHPMRSNPKITPCPAAVTTNSAGILKTSKARQTATSKPLKAEIQTRFFRATKTKNSVSTGKAEIVVESSWLLNGSYSCCQFTRHHQCVGDPSGRRYVGPDAPWVSVSMGISCFSSIVTPSPGRSLGQTLPLTGSRAAFALVAHEGNASIAAANPSDFVKVLRAIFIFNLLRQGCTSRGIPRLQLAAHYIRGRLIRHVFNETVPLYNCFRFRHPHRSDHER